MLSYTKSLKEVKNYTGTHEELVAAIANREEIYNFIGGCIATEAMLNTVVSEDEDGNKVLVRDKYTWFETNDSRTCLNFLMKQGAGDRVLTSAEFYELYDLVNPNTMLTKSEREALMPVVDAGDVEEVI